MGKRVLAALLVVASVLLVAGPAAAHGEDESKEAGVLVRQAIAFLVNEPDDVMAAAEKVEDATATDDTDGVDMALVRQAQRALAAGERHRGRALLERSIGARSHLDAAEPAPIRETTPMPMASAMGSSMAVGAESGIDVVSDPLSPHRGLTGGDRLALVGLVALAAAGVALAVRFRPPALDRRGQA